MNDRIVLNVPPEIAERARRIAESSAQAVEQVLMAHLATLMLPVLHPVEQAELDALHFLSDDALRTIAREQMPDDAQARAHVLMNANNHGLLTEDERAELETLVVRADQVMLRKAEAAALLRARGHAFSQSDFLSPHE
ncbi:MAG: hypothetical protein SGJ24_05030 [Chloroflexota bacterium]|nr:hypothetical protein [Chloroflexota bacterium]